MPPNELSRVKTSELKLSNSGAVRSSAEFERLR